MAAKSETKVATAVAVEEPIVAEEENLLEDATTHLVEALDVRGTIYKSCEESYLALNIHGLDAAVLAARVTDSIIARDYAGREDSDLAKAARGKSVVEGGAKITGAAIKNRATAWALVLTVGVPHTPENVKQAFTLVSVGRGRTIAAEEIIPEATRYDGPEEEKAEWFTQRLEQGRLKMRATSPRNAANRNALNLEKVLTFLKAVPVHAWTEGEVETILSALETATAEMINPPAEESE
jgi:hypothetical protein